MAVSLAERSLHSSVHLSTSVAAKVALVLLGAAATAVAAQFTLTLPFTPVPFTFGPMAVLLVGAVLGARLGAASQVLYLAAGAAGLAVFAPSLTLPNGFLRLVGPTGGYLLAYPAAAFLTGWLAERGWDRRYVTSALAMTAGLVPIYLTGVSWLAIAFVGSLEAAWAAGAAAFLLQDLAKIAVAALALPAAWRLVGPGAPSGR